MDETKQEAEKTQEKETQETAAEHTNKRDVNEAGSPIDRANAAAERAEKAAEELKRENDRLEELQVRRRLGGVTEGAEPNKVEKEESPVDYAKRVQEGNIQLKE